jgi:hypothetical protein
MNRPTGTEKPRLWKATNETTYPLGRRDTDPFPGTLHSTTAVSGGSCRASTRWCSWSRDMLDRVQFDMAAMRSQANHWREWWLCCGRKKARGTRRKGRGI